MSARCMKTSLNANAAAGHTISYTTKKGASPIDTMHYVLDAAGNIMAVYRNKKIEEQPIYGSARIGEYAGKEKEGYQTFNLRKYELGNHLGNVLAVISDKVNLYGHDNRLDSARATVMSAGDYYPFGLPMKGRQFNEKNYRYGFNGMENDNEVNGEGNHLDYGARGRTPRLGGGWWSIDPLASKYPGISPYAFCFNNPNESTPGNPDYDKNRPPYALSENNCGTFAADCMNQDPTVDRPSISNPTPTNIVDEYQEEGNARVTYDPKTKKSTIGNGDESDAKVEPKKK